MKRVDINTNRRSLTDEHADQRNEYLWSTLSKARISRATPALFDELSIIFDTLDGQVYVTETDPEFTALVEALAFDKLLPEEWYVKAEAGQIYNITLTNQGL
ncbi:MAG: hypothetical protein ABW157_16035 [Candidatus Thiodiazotropha sp. LLP2]